MAIVTCGGLCPGLNDVVQGLVRKLEDYGVPDGNIIGIRYTHMSASIDSEHSYAARICWMLCVVYPMWCRQSPEWICAWWILQVWVQGIL